MEIFTKMRVIGARATNPVELVKSVFSEKLRIRKSVYQVSLRSSDSGIPETT